MNKRSVVILIADGLTPEVLDEAIRDGVVPELAALAAENGRHLITTVFPSVTGVAYIPMLTGVHPAEAGIPGLRWFDRSRRLSALLGRARSYVGLQIRSMNDDLLPTAVTAFERVGGDALGMETVITRGLPRHRQLDRGAAYAARVIHAHLAGDVARWAALEEERADRLITRVRRERPRFVFAAFTSGDKAAHRDGAGSAGVRRSLQLVDHVARSIRCDAERDGRWSSMQLWVASDHGHSPLEHHLDIADEMRGVGIRVRSHPWTVPDRSEAAVMVGGNGMAHIYLDLAVRTRRDWKELSSSWSPRIEALLSHAAIDIVAMRTSPSTVLIRRGARHAEIAVTENRFSYREIDGDPLGCGSFEGLCDDEAHERCADSEYPDAVVQLGRLVLAERSGDVIISASPGWDLRRRYEPINHVSSHGALHRAHMMVPLVGNRRLEVAPRRTTDLFQILMREID